MSQILRLIINYRFHLECKVKAVPEAQITWFKNHVKIEDDLEGITFPSPDRMEFTEPRKVHEGRYHCTANNSMGLAVSEVILVSPTGNLYNLKSAKKLSSSKSKNTKRLI